jgi:ribulose 1,5-bisphosphate synthetase/thiazole synthase
MITSSSAWPIKGHFDFVVIGAGPAGIGASIAAARRGLRVALIEKAGFAGGAGNQCGISLYYGFGVNGKQSTAGISDEFIRKMDEMGSASMLINNGHETPDYKPIGNNPLNAKVQLQPEITKVVFNRMLTEAGVTCIFYTHMADVLMDGNTVKAVLLAGLEGTYLLEADVFADCTGDALLCYLANPDSVEKCTKENGMHQSLFINVAGVTPFDIEYNKKLYRELYEKGLVPPFVWDYFGFSILLNPGVVQIGMCYSVGDGVDSLDMTRMDRELREHNLEMVAFLRKYMPGFQNCWLEQTAQRVGVRVSRCIKGMEKLTEDILFTDEYINPIALCWREYGAHSNNTKFTSDWAKRKDGCGAIPMGTLIPKAFDNVVVAGRCLSAEIKLTNTFRMMNTCMTTGEAAGLLANVSIKANKRLKDIHYDELLPFLHESGFILV